MRKVFFTLLLLALAVPAFAQPNQPDRTALGNAIAIRCAKADLSSFQDCGSAGGSGGIDQQDKTGFTEGTTHFNPVGGVLNDTISSDPTEDQAAAARITPKRALHVNLRDNAGNELSVGGGTQYNQGTVAGSADTMTMAGCVRADTAAVDAGVIDGDRVRCIVDATGRMWVHVGTIDGGTITSITNAVQVKPDGTIWALTGTSANVAVTNTPTVTANAGTNLNTSALALEAGGNLATVAGAVNTGDSAYSKHVTMGAVLDDVATGAVTENQSNSLRMSSRRALLVEGVASGTAVTVGQATGTNLHAVIDSGSTTAVTQSTASNLNATVVGTGTFAVQAASTLAAETTKVIGTVRVLGNGGATVDSTVGAGTAPTNQVVTGGIYNSTEPSPTTGQALAVQLDAKGRARSVIMDAAGNTRGLNVDANGEIGISAIRGTLPAFTAIPTVKTDQTTHGTTDKVAADVYVNASLASATNPLPVVFPGTLVSGAVTTAMTGTTSTSVVGGTASNYLYITNCVVSNASTTVSTDIILQDGSGGTTLYNIPAPAAAVATTGGGGASVSFPVPLKVPTSGNALYAANVTTGSSTKISCSGFRSTVSY